MNIEQFTRLWLLPELGTTRIDRVKASDVLTIRSLMLEKGRSITTVNNAHKVLKLILGYGIRVGYLDRMPFRVSMLKAQRKPRPTISINKVQEFFSVLDEEARNPLKKHTRKYLIK